MAGLVIKSSSDNNGLCLRRLGGEKCYEPTHGWRVLIGQKDFGAINTLQ